MLAELATLTAAATFGASPGLAVTLTAAGAGAGPRYRSSR